MPPRRRKLRSAFELKLDAAARERITNKWILELEAAIDARGSIVGDDSEITQWHNAYEGGNRKRGTKQTPWGGAADLPSFIPTEKVDAWRARVMQIIFTEPVWMVEGWGDAATRAPIVEEFHQWKVEEERLQNYMGRVVHNALVEGLGVLEVAVRPRPRVIPRMARFLLEMDPTTQAPIYDPETGGPRLMLENGAPVEVEDEAAELPAVMQEIDEVVNVASGPSYRVISLRDFVYAPSYVADQAEVYAYGKRYRTPLDEIQRLAALGIYDAESVEKLSASEDKITTGRDRAIGTEDAGTTPDRSTKELWEWLVLEDLDGDEVAEWYVATLSLETRTLLRLEKLRIGRPTYVLMAPFPRPDSLYGYSLVAHKLNSIADEHTATRNMIADRSALKVSAPILRVRGSLWDEQEVPWGPRAIIDVNDPNELTQMRVEDVPGSLIERERNILASAERVSGLNDTALGVHPQVDRTLGEVQTVTAQSFVRIDESIRYLQEAMEQIFALRHEIWKMTLRDQGAIPLPPAVLSVLEGRGVHVEAKEVTAETLEGIFRGKPRGSVETADPNRRRADFTGFLQSMAQLAGVVPALQAYLGQPNVQQAILEQAMHVFNWRYRQGLVPQASALGFGRIPNLLGAGAGAPGMAPPPMLNPAGPGGPPA